MRPHPGLDPGSRLLLGGFERDPGAGAGVTEAFFMKRIILATLPILALAACATPESRVRTALIEAGLPRPIATCMAQRMVDRLSMAQLQRLSRLSGLGEAQIGAMTVREFTRRVSALGDPEILSVVTTAGIGCAIAA
jgi:hypothetical protein